MNHVYGIAGQQKVYDEFQVLQRLQKEYAPGSIAEAKQPGLMEGLRGAHDFLDKLHASINGLEERLSPLLAPTNQAQGAPTAPPSCDPIAIEQLAGVLVRVQMLTAHVERITSQVRI